MAVRRGVVVKIKGGLSSKALVRATRMTACENCSSRSDCCDKGNGKNEVEIEVPNIVNAHVGDTVIIELSDSSILRATFLVYIVPVIFMVLGGFLGYYLVFFDKLSFFHSLPIFVSFLFLGLSFWAVRFVGKYLSNKPEYSPKIIRIVK